MTTLLIRTIQLAFSVYTLLLFANVIGSWIPKLAYDPRFRSIYRFIRFCTEPYFNLFRKFIPPIGGTIDISPLIGFFALSMLEKFMMKFITVFF